MSHQTRREYLLSIHGRYRRAKRKQKQVILNEFCANTGYNRKCAIRLLNGPTPSFGYILDGATYRLESYFL